MDFAEMLAKLVARAGQNREKMGILAVKNSDRLTLWESTLLLFAYSLSSILLYSNFYITK